MLITTVSRERAPDVLAASGEFEIDTIDTFITSGPLEVQVAAVQYMTDEAP